MKLLFAVVFSILLIFSLSCSKSHPSSPAQIANNLQGSWELRFWSVSWWPDSTFTPGNGNYITFTTKEWTQVQGSSMIHGTYTIIKNVQPPTPLGACNEISVQEYPWRIIGVSNGDTILNAGLRLAGDSLTLRSGCFAADGGSLKKYVRPIGYL